MANLQRTPMLDELRASIAAHRTWFIILGIALIVLGILAIFFPLASSVAVKIYLGWLFMIGGVVQIVHGFQTKGWKSTVLGLLLGALYLVAGAWLAFLPLTGLLTLTIFLAFLFMFEGVMEAVMAVQLRPLEGWGWVLFSGIVALLAGFLLLVGLPGTATWAIGLMAAINLISSGWSYLFLALASKESATDA